MAPYTNPEMDFFIFASQYSTITRRCDAGYIKNNILWQVAKLRKTDRELTIMITKDMLDTSDGGPNYVTQTAREGEWLAKFPPPSNSAIRRDGNIIPVFIPRFSGVKFSMAPSETLQGETGSQKSTMAKSNVTQLLYTIATKFQRLYPCFMSRVT